MTSTQPRVQRKRAAHAPLHVKRILTSSHLAEEVHAKAKGRLPRALPVRKGDTVRVMRGGFRGREGKVVSVDRVHGRSSWKASRSKRWTRRRSRGRSTRRT